jgi:hypothetical protein
MRGVGSQQKRGIATDRDQRGAQLVADQGNKAVHRVFGAAFLGDIAQDRQIPEEFLLTGVDRIKAEIEDEFLRFFAHQVKGLVGQLAQIVKGNRKNLPLKVSEGFLRGDRAQVAG